MYKRQGFAQAGFPYMGVGRNLAYASEVFFSARKPKSHNRLMSGDDDLFINEVARANNTAVVADPASFMVTRATPDLATWIRRKRRHYTTAVHYRLGHQILLMLLPLARMVFWTSLVLLVLHHRWMEVAIGAGIRLCVIMPITIRALQKLQAGALAWFALPLEWLFLLLDPLIYTSTILVKPKRWK